MASGSRGALAAIVLIVVAASACSGSAAPKKDTAAVVIGKVRAELTVTTCRQTEQGLHVVAQSGGAWTLDLRHDATAKSNILLVVERRSGRTITYQASGNAVHPSGTPPTKISVQGRGGSLHGTATVQRSVSSGGRGARQSSATFNLSCAKVTPAS